MTIRTAREWTRVDPAHREILKKYRGEFPVKLGALARDLGVEIKVSTMKPGISGQITREDGKYVVRVNRHEIRERQRFTIAHELSHFLLHRDVIDSSPDGIVDNVLYRSGKAENIEFEANRLAADLVMPAEKIEERLMEFGKVVTDEVIDFLASEFQVSKAAMEIRLNSYVAA